MKPIVVVENISKKYSRNANEHLSYGISDLFREVFGRDKTLELRTDEFLAVNDLSFHLYPGDSFALIGRNGSGKTTTLKMMNGLVKPDAGTVIMDGRVQALINLGAGFNQELSGRDNVHNAAALMGLSRKEANAILDDVVDFSELEEFIDSPIQTYSQGMRARLGFAVAVHLKPDILLIDEILSVGDFAFQNKCFTRMQELKKAGVTIVLVSHSHTRVIQMCERALWIHKGKVMQLGPAKEAVHAYLDFLDSIEVKRVQAAKAQEEDKQETPTPSKAPVKAEKKSPAEGSLYGPIYDDFDRIEDLEFSFLVNGSESDSVSVHDELVLEYEFRLKDRVEDLNVSLVFYRKDGLQLSAISTLNGDLLKHIHTGKVRCRVRIPDFSLSPGNYVLVMPVHEGKSYLYRNVVKEFVVTRADRIAWCILDLEYDYNVEHEGGH